MFSGSGETASNTFRRERRTRRCKCQADERRKRVRWEGIIKACFCHLSGGLFLLRSSFYSRQTRGTLRMAGRGDGTGHVCRRHHKTETREGTMHETRQPSGDEENQIKADLCWLAERTGSDILTSLIRASATQGPKIFFVWFRFPTDPVNLCATQIIL